MFTHISELGPKTWGEIQVLLFLIIVMSTLKTMWAVDSKHWKSHTGERILQTYSLIQLSVFLGGVEPIPQPKQHISEKTSSRQGLLWIKRKITQNIFRCCLLWWKQTGKGYKSNTGMGLKQKYYSIFTANCSTTLWRLHSTTLSKKKMHIVVPHLWCLSFIWPSWKKFFPFLFCNSIF